MPSRNVTIVFSFSLAFAWSSLHAAGPGTGKFSKYDAQAKKLMARMTVEEKIGQMLQPDQMFLKSIDDIDKYHVGSVLSGGDSDPKTGNDWKSWTDLYERNQSRALQTRLKVPILYGVDAVHGHNNVEGATVFPQNIGLGATRDAALVEKIAQITAEEVRSNGIQWGFAPCVTVPQDIRWGRTFEGFGDDPEIVRPLGAAVTRGLQGANLSSNGKRVLACAKHLAGDGGTTYGTGLKNLMDHGDTQVDEATFRRIHLAGYPDSIAAGVGSIMPSYSSWNGVKCSANKHLLTEIIKDEMGFEGFIISDYNAIDEIPGDLKEQVRASVMAGMDMFMEVQRYAEVFESLKQLVSEGAVPMSRIDDAVLRILRVKAAMGMLAGKNNQLADRSLEKSFGSPEHRAVARQAVRESMVLLKNDGNVLPLSRSAKRIHVAGKSADDIGNQCGGWTITWQGHSGPVTKGTTILAGMREVAPSVNFTFSRDGSGAEGADAGVLFLGETPYSEMFGDKPVASFFLDAEDKAALANMKRAGIPITVVVVSGRPLFIDDVMDQAGAWMAAWLPGSEGAGVADVLFGVAKPQGKLSFTWPKSTSTSLHIGDPGYQTQFARGYGLSYGN